MYENVKLEKGMYHLANMSFSEALEAADPSAQYADTPLAKLDAFERQLKRFNIHLSGTNCDLVEKFFATTESAVLFPEYVRRAVKQGLNESPLQALTAAVTRVNGTTYRGFRIEDDTGYDTTTDEGNTLPTTFIYEATDTVTLDKYGRLVNASYETVRQQRIDVFTVMLRSIGRKLAAALTAKALNVLKSAVSAESLSGDNVTYTDLANLYGAFTDYDLTTVIASPATVAEILAMGEMQERTLAADGSVRLPFGAVLLKDASLDDEVLIGISRDFALESITGCDVLLETDRLIDSQLDRIAVSVRAGFRPLMEGAVAVMANS